MCMDLFKNIISDLCIYLSGFLRYARFVFDGSTATTLNKHQERVQKVFILPSFDSFKSRNSMEKMLLYQS